LKELSSEDRKRIGEDIKTVEFGGPLGKPICRPLAAGHLQGATLSENRIARVFFYIDQKARMVLLHSFIKKTRKTPDGDLNLAGSKESKHQGGLQ
jgi:phage-related protein